MLSSRKSASERVVVTGLGVVAPSATDLNAFRELLRQGRSAASVDPDLVACGFGCQVSHRATLAPEVRERYMSELDVRRLRAAGVRYGLVAGLGAIDDAGLEPEEEQPNWRRGVVFGAGVVGVDVLGESMALVDAGKVKRLGSSAIETQMPSSVAALLAGRLGFAAGAACNSSACATGTESLLIGAARIRSGEADVMLVGSTESEGRHLWGAFDALRVCPRDFNQTPELASRPLSATAAGFVPGSGAGALVLESLEHARGRGARVYCELLGGHVNSGGQRAGGSMTAQSPPGIVRCVTRALADAQVEAQRVDAISGHLTATNADPSEIECWCTALGRGGADFPLINAPKSLFGHALSASGALELVACALQIHDAFLHPSINCEDLHPCIAKLIDPTRVVRSQQQSREIEVMAKASFGFGDVNACVVLGSDEGRTS